MEQELRRMFEMKEPEMTVPPTLSPELRTRIGRQRMAMGGLVAAVAVAIVIGGFAGARSLSRDDAAPVPPAEEGKQEIEPMRNGRILHAEADDMNWGGTTAPPPPGGDETYHWNAFDQDTGSFLYAAQSPEGRVWVVGEDGLVAEFDCPASLDCRNSDALGHVSPTEMATFGPGPDEITAPSADGRSAHVIGFDGTLRDTLDISEVFSQGQNLSDLAWSADGNRLAVSTEFESSTGCDRTHGPCGRVWIFERDGREPQMVYIENTTAFSALGDLAWSPDGDTVAVLVGPDGLCTGRQPWPRLVALRMAPDEPIRAETVWVYDDYRPQAKECILSDHYHLAFPFAWSPDGTRIAVASGYGIAEMSAENGEVLARHPDPGEGVEGPLAWLPKR